MSTSRKPTQREARALQSIAERAVDIAELQAITGWSHTVANGVLDRLAGLGEIRRAPIMEGASSSRLDRYSITAAGRALIEQAG